MERIELEVDESSKDYTSFLDAIGNKALANGLTPEILYQLLKEDE